MRSTSEPLSPSLRLLHDTGTLVLLALVLVPLYLLLNRYWQSLVLLLVFYGLLCLFCLRLAEYTRRAMRRLPAEIPPWHPGPTLVPSVPGLERHFSAAEAIRSVRKDPHYVQEVFKPRLQQLVVYRLTGMPALPVDVLDAAQLARLNPLLRQFLQRQENIGLWARCCQRQRRVDTVLAMLQCIEGL